MNEHEIERIAAAINQLRPDWPAKSLRTLIANKLADRPRRDVTVALAWIACESATSTPARVLEPGPWWRAAAVDGATTPATDGRAGECCIDCGKPEHHQIHANDHGFSRHRQPEGDPSAKVAHLRGLIRAIKTATEGETDD